MSKVVVNFSVNKETMEAFRIAVIRETGKSREMSRVVEGLMETYIDRIEGQKGG